MPKITTHEIECATNTIELDRLVENAAAERNCELDNSHTYLESADFLSRKRITGKRRYGNWSKSSVCLKGAGIKLRAATGG